MSRTLIAALLIVAAAACSKSPSEPNSTGAKSSAAHTLISGTTIVAATQRTISSASDQAGDNFSATVSQDITDSRNRVLIPAGSTLNLSISHLESASKRGDADGKITVLVNSVTVGNRTYPISADITSMAYSLKGQGVTAGQIEKTAGGAVIGGVAGRIVGGNAKGTVIGAVVGGVAGAVIAGQATHRDVVVAAGTPIVVTLSGPATLDK